MTKYTVGVIGAGRIVAGFDSPDDTRILTHLHALTGHPRFDLVGVHDADRAALAAAASKWGVRPVSQFTALTALRPDVFVIAVPDEHHDSYLSALLDVAPLLVVCEKPLTTSLGASAAFVAAYQARGVRLAVGYQRRFDADINAMRTRFLSGELGRFLTGTVTYSKGLLHNGSHAVDLLRYILGPVERSDAFAVRDDFTPGDPTISARLTFAAGDVFLLIGDERCFSVFDVDLVFEKARYRLTESGLRIEISTVRDDPHFVGYRTLVIEDSRPSTLDRALGRMWDDTARALDDDRPMVNAGTEALETQRVCIELAAKLAPRPAGTP